MFWSEQALSRRRTNETPCRCTCTARNFPTARTTIFSHHEWIGNANNGRIFHYYILSSHQWISQTPNAETVCLSTSPYLFWLFACERNELLVYASRERKREREDGLHCSKSRTYKPFGCLKETDASSIKCSLPFWDVFRIYKVFQRKVFFKVVIKNQGGVC